MAAHLLGLPIKHKIADVKDLAMELAEAKKWILVSEVEVELDTTTVSFTGLDLDAVRFYMLLTLIKTVNGNSDFAIYFNNDTVATHYYTQGFYAGHTTRSSSRLNKSLWHYNQVNNASLCYGFIGRAPDGYPRWTSMQNTKSPSVIAIEMRFGVLNVVGNVTRIDITASTANAIGAGSKLLLFKAV